MRARTVGVILLLSLCAAASARLTAASKLSVGIVPFDVATVDGASVSNGEAVAKLVRIEMIKNSRLAPVLLPAPAGAGGAAAKPPAPKTDVVLVGTVLSAETSGGSHSANTGGLLSGIGVGGSINRVTTEVALHIELTNPATGEVLDTFEVAAKSSGTSLGADFSSSLGSIDSGGAGADNSSLGKALREAAQKVAAEVAKRADKLAVK
jgi:hypothetical protein